MAIIQPQQGQWQNIINPTRSVIILHMKTIKSLLFILMLLCASEARAEDTTKWYERMELTGQAAALLQYNETDLSKVTPISSRASLQSDWLLEEGAHFTMRIYSTGGRNTLKGGVRSDAPTNDMTHLTEQDIENRNTPPVRTDLAYVQYETDGHYMAIGLMELDGGATEGFLANEAILDGTNGFVTGHFTKTLGVNFFDEQSAPTLPAIAYRYRLNDSATVRAALSFGDSGQHFFIRNTGIVEFDLKHNAFGSEQSIKLAIGFSDADESTTHKLSPSAALSLCQRIGESTRLFAVYSHAEEENRVSSLFGSYLWHAKAGLTYASEGDTRTSRHYAGIGLSAARSYYSDTSEKSIEAFWRYRLNQSAHVTLDLAVLFDASGTPEGQSGRVYLPGVRAVVAF